jgi:hypothetical protein
MQGFSEKTTGRFRLAIAMLFVVVGLAVAGEGFLQLLSDNYIAPSATTTSPHP